MEQNNLPALLSQVYPIPFTRLSQTSIDGCSLSEYRSSQIETAKTEKNQSRWNSSWTKALRCDKLLLFFCHSHRVFSQNRFLIYGVTFWWASAICSSYGWPCVLCQHHLDCTHGMCVCMSVIVWQCQHDPSNDLSWDVSQRMRASPHTAEKANGSHQCGQAKRASHSSLLLLSLTRHSFPLSLTIQLSISKPLIYSHAELP